MFRPLSLVLLLLNLNLANAEVLDKIVAVVNDQVITQSQVDNLLDQMHKQIAQMHMTPVPSEAQLRKDALNQLIDRDLQLQLVQKANITISNEELAQAINSIAEQNHFSTAELKDKISADGLSYPQFEQQIRQQILITKLEQMALGSKVKVSDAEVNKAVLEAEKQQQAFVEYDISDILVPLPENPSAAQLNEADSRAAELIKQLKAGTKPAELTTVVEESGDGSGAEEKPGFFARLFKKTPNTEKHVETNEAASPEQISTQDLGLRKQADLPEAFVTQLATLKATGIAGPIHTANGLHILHLNEIKAPPMPAINSMVIRNQLYQQAIMKELPAWMTEIRKTAYIKINE